MKAASSVTWGGVAPLPVKYPTAWRLSDNSIGGSGKIVFKDMGGGGIRNGICSILQGPSLAAATEY